jgi:Raf kinase inhibitor-like YbhB/YbcL family protein
MFRQARKVPFPENRNSLKAVLPLAILAALAMAQIPNAHAQQAAQNSTAPSGGSGGPGGGSGGPPDMSKMEKPILTIDRPQADAKTKEPLKVTSATLTADGYIPLINTGYGKNISPQVSWSKGPAGTQSYLLIVEDASAGMDRKGVLHWLAFNIPASVTSLEEGIAKLPAGMVQGAGQRGDIGYQGPHTPAGYTFHYAIQIFALDKTLDLATGASRDSVWEAMSGHVLAKGDVIGLYTGPAKQ